MIELNQKLKKIISIFLVCFALWSGHFSEVYADDDKSVITIEHAQKSEYKKDPVNGGDCIILSGDVKISVARGSSKTVINASTVNYNRATEMIYAEGSVELSQTGGSAGGETITATSLLFNTATLEGVFDNGRAVQASSDAINLPSGSKLIVASEMFGRDSGGTIAFKTGELTFCDEENPHWRIKASRIWLLPGGEFAFLNAILYVGNVPLLWLPAFYYPKDELLFNPAFGYRAREGYFINTTTYLYGRKPADAKSTADLKSSSSSDSDDKIDFFSFMKTGAMKEQRREGLVLHNLDEDFSGDTSSYLKVMADYYANLGAMVGLDGAFNPGAYLTKLEARVQLGFSNTIFNSNGTYFTKSESGEVISDKSNFMGFEMPFRYQAGLKLAFSKPFTFNLDMPVYSDPFFDYDFNTRAETMDWIDFAMSGTDTDSSDSNDISEISSFTWNASGSYTFKLPDFLNPYISNLSISSFGASVAYSSKKAELSGRNSDSPTWKYNTPEQKFYYPSQVTPFKISGRISGTLVQYPSTKKAASSSVSGITLLPPEELDMSEKKEKTDDKKEVSSSEANKNSVEAETTEDVTDEPVLAETALPKIAGPSFSSTKLTGISYNLGYSVSPDFSSQFSYSSTALSKPEDFSWSDMQSTYIQVKAPTTVTSKIGFRDSFLSLTDTFTFNPAYQRHPYLKITETADAGGYTDDSAKSIKASDYAAKKLDLTDTNALTFRPFYLTEHFSDTSLTWNTTIKLIRTEYLTEAKAKEKGVDWSIDNPQWDYLTADLTDEDCVTSHNLNLVLAASEFNKKVKQQLSLTTTLPPQVDAYRGSLTFTFPYVSLNAGTGIHRKSSTDSTWVKDDFSQSSSVTLFNSKLKFTQGYVYDMEEKENESFKLALSGYGFQIAKNWSYVVGYEFDENSGWKTKASTEKKFQPYQLSFAYSSPSMNFKALSDRISFAPTLSTSVVYDYLRPTSSYLRFIPSLTFKINNFLNISLSAESKNSVIYRYFCSDSDYKETYYKGNGERNVLKDLMDSFRFDDKTTRENSGFKIQNLKIDVTHDLDDWDLNCSFSIKPRYVTSSMKGYSGSGSPYYDFSPHFSISVSWRPLASMKTEIVDEYGEWELNP